MIEFGYAKMCVTGRETARFFCLLFPKFAQENDV